MDIGRNGEQSEGSCPSNLLDPPLFISSTRTADLLTRVPTSDAKPFYKVHVDGPYIRGVGIAISTYGARQVVYLGR
jgi:hypothetical protein